jgi:hypothetical protein
MKIKDLVGYTAGQLIAETYYRSKKISENRHGYDDSGMSLAPGNDEGEDSWDYSAAHDRIGAGDPRRHRQHHHQVDVPHDVHINGKKWKTFGSHSHASNVAKKIKGATVHKAMGEQYGDYSKGATNPDGTASAQRQQDRARDALEYARSQNRNGAPKPLVPGKPMGESATAGATSAANIGTVDAPHLSPGKARGKKSYTGSVTTGSGTKAPPQPVVKQPKKKDGTAVNGLDIKGSSLFGGPANEAAVIKRR